MIVAALTAQKGGRHPPFALQFVYQVGRMTPEDRYLLKIVHPGNDRLAFQHRGKRHPQDRKQRQEKHQEELSSHGQAIKE